MVTGQHKIVLNVLIKNQNMKVKYKNTDIKSDNFVFLFLWQMPLIIKLLLQ